MKHKDGLLKQPPDQLISLKILSGISMGFDILQIVFTSKLLGFHLFIITKGITTYQYIIEKLEEKEGKKKKSKVIT